eukprot:snap_masked-scaffold_1-processed-gene-1.21-mRNA-1 protein AED:1.00 eAED:1.00 QI:0/0/0/0/1/1/2/0/59
MNDARFPEVVALQISYSIAALAETVFPILINELIISLLGACRILKLLNSSCMVLFVEEW